MARSKGAGRKPKPSHIKKLEGNPGGRKLNDKEPTPTPELLPCPPHITGDAKAEWERISPKLYRLGLLSEIDGAALAGYCQSYAIWADATRNMEKLGYIVEINGHPQQSPYYNVMNRALKEMKAFMVEFGMTPSSRSRISALPPAPPSKSTKSVDDETPDWDNMFTPAATEDSKAH
jgi:P27 family predicted phage terminase small subunit